ncbi:MAG: 3-deoxy-manno-octulosonate cytidylyltransferase [Pseudomonadota bacterium]
MPLTAAIVIPARYQSMRFPGKPLVMLNGRTLIERVYDLARQVPDVAGVYVATDDDRIKAHVAGFGGQVLMTPESCQNGTERVAAAALMLPDTINAFVNWQGDSPLTPIDYPKTLLTHLSASKAAELVTPVIRCDRDMLLHLRAERGAGQVGGVTVVSDVNNRALHFSREVIPWSDALVNAPDPLPVFYHVGMYAYRRDVLLQYPSWTVGPIERTENLEQLRFVENGRVVEALEMQGAGHWEVNKPEDVPLVERLLKEHGL